MAAEAEERYFWRDGEEASGCEPSKGTAKNPAVLAVSMPLEYRCFGQVSAPLICLPNVPLHFH